MSFELMWHELAPVGRSASSGGYFRQPFGTAEREAVAWFEEAAAARGLRVERDGFGNLKAVWDATAAGPAGGTVLTGSHLDSVLDGGAFDGPLGVVTALAALDLLRERGFSPTRPIAVGVFIEEEGSRFGLGCIGSRLAAGALDLAKAETLSDRNGVPLLDAMADAGLDPSSGSRLLDDVDCFVELHVE
jgi:beta-ureidopropionase / N-carbamoyl-L-amino-acid hydrolase